MLLYSLLLALLWSALWADWHPLLFGVGLGLGFVLLETLSRRGAFGSSFWVRRLDKAFVFGLLYLWEILLSNLRTARQVLLPQGRVRPAIIAVPISLRQEGQIMLLANLVSLTPGTLSLDVSTDRSTLYVHVLDLATPPEAFRQSFVRGFQRSIREIFER